VGNKQPSSGSRTQQPSKQNQGISTDSGSLESIGNPGFQKSAGSRGQSGGALDGSGDEGLGEYKQTGKGGQERPKQNQGSGQNAGGNRPTSNNQQENNGQEQVSSEDLSGYNPNRGQPQAQKNGGGGRKPGGDGEGVVKPNQKGQQGQKGQAGQKQTQQAKG